MNDLEVGIAGEHIVAADLLLSGCQVHMADQTRPYDLIVEYNGKLLRVQVKTTKVIKAIPQRKSDVVGYTWHIKRAGSGESRYYKNDEYDVLALVGLETKQVAYLDNTKTNVIVIQVPPVKNSKRSFESMSFEAALSKSGDHE